jgi:hypothetical protein
MTAVDNILAGQLDKSNLWEVNTENEYHEEKNLEAVRDKAERPYSPLEPAAKPRTA